MKQKISGWGKHPIIDSEVFNIYNSADASFAIENTDEGICFGNGRSYGDSALAKNTYSTKTMNYFTNFNPETGSLSCQSGVTLKEILDVFVKRGWFLPVVPGTKLITVGGAIAADIHGKNHHLEGSFCDHITSLTLLTANGETVVCSNTENSDIFYATCGGMGLTGIILEATINLKPIKSAYINEHLIKANNLDEIVDLFEEYKNSTYSVAWIDALAKGKSLGRSILMLGEHVEDGEYSQNFNSKKSIGVSVPIDAPNWALNQYSIKAFNTAFWTKERKKESTKTLHYDPYFFPLDGVNNWNKLYGKNGFTQYQFVIPFEAGKEALSNIVSTIANSGKGSFLAVLKTFGKENENYLSFPMPGFTLALDFKLDADIYKLFNNLDAQVNEFGGRIYLAKDVRMDPETFKLGYPRLNKFLKVKKSIDPKNTFASLQSKRLKINN